MHALIIGDHRLLADLLKRDLIASGYDTVEVASDEQHALLLAQAGCPDLILVDDHNSVGLAVSLIRALCDGAAIPVVYVTGNAKFIRRQLPYAVTVDSFGVAALRSAIFKAQAGETGGASPVTDISRYR